MRYSWPYKQLSNFAKINLQNNLIRLNFKRLRHTKKLIVIFIKKMLLKYKIKYGIGDIFLVTLPPGNV